METHNKKKLAAILPWFHKPTIDYTYFYVHINDTIDEEDFHVKPPNPGVVTGSGDLQTILLSVIISVVLVLVIVVLVCIRLKTTKSKTKTNRESYKFYVKSPIRSLHAAEKGIQSETKIGGKLIISYYKV